MITSIDTLDMLLKQQNPQAIAITPYKAVYSFDGQYELDHINDVLVIGSAGMKRYILIECNAEDLEQQ